MECKTTSAKSYILKLSDLEKIKAEAVMGGMEGWAFQIEFQGATSNKRFAVIDWQEFLDLRKKVSEFTSQNEQIESPCPTCGAFPRRISCPLKCDDI